MSCDIQVIKIAQGNMAVEVAQMFRIFIYIPIYITVCSVLVDVSMYAVKNRRDWCMLYAQADTCDGFDRE